MTGGLVEHAFRHHFGRLVSVISRRVGFARLDAVEDAVQWALMRALERWPRDGVPADPSAWLHEVAVRQLISDGVLTARRAELLERFGSGSTAPPSADDEPLWMLFVACDDALPLEAQLVFALKTLCGFDVREIAQRLFTSEENVYKRLSRARAHLREAVTTLELSPEEVTARLPAVRAVLHALFTEGHLSSSSELVIRRELCAEAIRLTTLLAESRWGRGAETSALLALMHLHAARLDARVDERGGLVLLEEQDRSRWDQGQLALGLRWLEASAEGSVLTRYHAEAGLAAEHCLAPSLSETRWDRVVELYELLERLAPSPLHTLSRALALAELKGPEAALELLEPLVPPSWLAGSYLWSAALADLHRRAGHAHEAARHRAAALEAAPTEHLRVALERRLNGERRA